MYSNHLAAAFSRRQMKPTQMEQQRKHVVMMTMITQMGNVESSAMTGTTAGVMFRASTKIPSPNIPNKPYAPFCICATRK